MAKVFLADVNSSWFFPTSQQKRLLCDAVFEGVLYVKHRLVFETHVTFCKPPEVDLTYAQAQLICRGGVTKLYNATLEDPICKMSEIHPSLQQVVYTATSVGRGLLPHYAYSVKESGRTVRVALDKFTDLIITLDQKSAAVTVCLNHLLQGDYWLTEDGVFIRAKNQDPRGIGHSYLWSHNAHKVLAKALAICLIPTIYRERGVHGDCDRCLFQANCLSTQISKGA